jgi:hypothetical protein
MKNCENCGELISARRLAAMPDAVLCVECQADVDLPLKAKDIPNGLAVPGDIDDFGPYPARRD